MVYLLCNIVLPVFFLWCVPVAIPNERKGGQGTNTRKDWYQILQNTAEDPFTAWRQKSVQNPKPYLNSLLVLRLSAQLAVTLEPLEAFGQAPNTSMTLRTPPKGVE